MNIENFLVNIFQPISGDSWRRISARRQDRELQRLLGEVHTDQGIVHDACEGKTVDFNKGKTGEKSYSKVQYSNVNPSISGKQEIKKSEGQVESTGTGANCTCTAGDSQNDKCKIKNPRSESKKSEIGNGNVNISNSNSGSKKRKDPTKKKRKKKVKGVTSLEATLEYIRILNGDENATILSHRDTAEDEKNCVKEDITVGIDICKEGKIQEKQNVVVLLKRIDAKCPVKELKPTFRETNVDSINVKLKAASERREANSAKDEEKLLQKLGKLEVTNTKKFEEIHGYCCTTRNTTAESQQCEENKDKLTEPSDIKTSKIKSNIFDLLVDTKLVESPHEEVKEEKATCLVKSVNLPNNSDVQNIFQKLKDCIFVVPKAESQVKTEKVMLKKGDEVEMMKSKLENNTEKVKEETQQNKLNANENKVGGRINHFASLNDIPPADKCEADECGALKHTEPFEIVGEIGKEVNDANTEVEENVRVSVETNDTASEFSEPCIYLPIDGKCSHKTKEVNHEQNDTKHEKSKSISPKVPKCDGRKRQNNCESELPPSKKQRFTTETQKRSMKKRGTFSRRMAVYRREKNKQECARLIGINLRQVGNGRMPDNPHLKPMQIALHIPHVNTTDCTSEKQSEMKSALHKLCSDVNKGYLEHRIQYYEHDDEIIKCQSILSSNTEIYMNDGEFQSKTKTESDLKCITDGSLPSAAQMIQHGFGKVSVANVECNQEIVHPKTIKIEPIDSTDAHTLLKSHCSLHGSMDDLAILIKKAPSDKDANIPVSSSSTVYCSVSDAARNSNTIDFGTVKTESFVGNENVSAPSVSPLPTMTNSPSCVSTNLPPNKSSVIIKKKHDDLGTNILNPPSQPFVTGEIRSQAIVETNSKVAFGSKFTVDETTHVTDEPDDQNTHASTSLLSQLLCEGDSVESNPKSSTSRDCCSGTPVIRNGFLYLHDDCVTSGAEDGDSDNDTDDGIGYTSLNDARYINIEPVNDDENGEKGYSSSGRDYIMHEKYNFQEANEPGNEENYPIASHLYEIAGSLLNTYRDDTDSYLKKLLEENTDLDAPKGIPVVNPRKGKICASQNFSVEHFEMRHTLQNAAGKRATDTDQDSKINVSWPSVDIDMITNDTCEPGQRILTVGIPGLGNVRCKVSVTDVSSEKGNFPMVLGTWSELARLIKFLHNYSCPLKPEKGNEAHRDRAKQMLSRLFDSPVRSLREDRQADIQQGESHTINDPGEYHLQELWVDVTEIDDVDVEYVPSGAQEMELNMKVNIPAHSNRNQRRCQVAKKTKPPARKTKKDTATRTKKDPFQKTMATYQCYQQQFASRKNFSHHRKRNSSLESSFSTDSSHDDQDEFRACQNHLEKQRRYAMAEDFDRLRSVIPPIAEKRASKICIINLAEERIDGLKREHRRLVEEMNYQKGRNTALRLKLEQLWEGQSPMVRCIDLT